jgi:hypothetical protein
VLFFLSLNALEWRSGTFFRRIFKVLTQSNHLTSRVVTRFLAYKSHYICLKYNKLNLC